MSGKKKISDLVNIKIVLNETSLKEVDLGPPVIYDERADDYNFTHDPETLSTIYYHSIKNVPDWWVRVCTASDMEIKVEKNGRLL